MKIWINDNIESHRNWLDNFGVTEDDEVLDQKNDDYVSAKNHPTVEVNIPAKSFQETVPEWINPVTGEELGEQIVSINVTEHLGIYYFENKQAVLDWITNTLDVMPGPVEEPDGEQDNIPVTHLPEIPAQFE
jgi:hypothetical protein|tara:strand:+ start:13321 stop:13716 length:396 start_codon:yes stop_codon:yes gene_type:complete